MAQSLTIIGPSVLFEVPTSPTWERGDVTRVTTVFRGASYDLALASAPPKGALGTGAYAGMKVVSSTVQKERGGIGVLTMVLEGQPPGDDEVTLPADVCNLEFRQDEVDLKTLPMFSALDSEELWAIDAYMNSAQFQDAEFWDWFHTSENATVIDLLISKLQRGVIKKFVWPPVYRLTTYSINEPATSGGGFRETPFGYITPPSGFDFLRAGDTVSFNGTYWELTRTWLGVPDMWDVDLYG